MATLGETWRTAQQQLEDSGFSPAPREGQALVCHVLGCLPLQLVTDEHKDFPPEKEPALAAMVARRLTGEPLAYLTGMADFWGYRWQVTADTLIPRPDTETLVRAALEVTPPQQPWRLAEVGVGSGAVVGSILLERPYAAAVGTDISAAALETAQANLIAHGVAGRVTCVETDLLEGVEGSFNLILSNPPYISENEYKELDVSVRNFEPRSALAAGRDGLDVYRRLIPAVADKLAAKGWLMLEMGHTQAEAVQSLMAHHGFSNLAIQRDLGGRERVICGQLAENSA